MTDILDIVIEKWQYRNGFSMALVLISPQLATDCQAMQCVVPTDLTYPHMHMFRCVHVHICMFMRCEDLHKHMPIPPGISVPGHGAIEAGQMPRRPTTRPVPTSHHPACPDVPPPGLCADPRLAFGGRWSAGSREWRSP